MNYTVGSLVRVRGREWVVLALPESKEQPLLLRPLGGTEAETTGIHPDLEVVQAATFAPPDPQALGDYRSGRLLRDAVRLGFRASAGPFRSFAHLGVEPRPYQLVPLLMALKLDPVRLLIADDVGIGKTVEACLIARELYDRGEITGLVVLCPPHLAEQWQVELREKFHLEATLVLASTATQLERTCRFGESIFQRYPIAIVSTDFIKSERRREEFLRTCPNCVMVDEAHTCADAGEGRGSHQQRYRLISQLAQDEERHLILVTATPHSGNEAAFRSLLRLLNPDFAQLPEDLTGAQHEQKRRKLAAHFVQRRRGDIRAYLQEQTPFPERKESEQQYSLTPAYRQLFEKVLSYARETISDPAGGNKQQQRVRWWSALALLRSLASSPAAAAATLHNRASTADAADASEADDIGRHTVMDLLDSEAGEALDAAPGSDFEDQAGETTLRNRLRALARDAEALKGAGDAKLGQAVRMVEGLIKDSFHPILFCRYIPTAEYVAQELRTRLPRDVQIEAITGLLPPMERENRILALSEQPKRVLVCTDCLSEGINLQHAFNAVIHYDLSWNPTRHEQREGRVDRYGQNSPEVRVVTYYGHDNPVDGIVLEVLIKKHNTIRTSLGISVPVPANSEQVLEAIFEGALLRGKSSAASGIQLTLPGLEDPIKRELDLQWNAAADREKRSRTMFAQESIKASEVAEELDATRLAMGSHIDVEHFTRDALSAYDAALTTLKNGALQVDYSTMRSLQPTQSAHEARGLKDALQTVLQSDSRVRDHRFKARFELPTREGELYLSRTHPVVESLAAYVMDAALDSTTGDESVARRCGVLRTSQVEKRTTLLLVRLRYHIITTRRNQAERTLLAEDCQLLAFQGALASAQWLDDPALIEHLLTAEPDGNISSDQARHFLQQPIAGLDLLQPYLNEFAAVRARELSAAHRRVRQAAQTRGLQTRVEPQLPVDVLGIYIYLPKNQ
jgi:superfamily II DNA or RNA helicase